MQAFVSRYYDLTRVFTCKSDGDWRFGSSLRRVKKADVHLINGNNSINRVQYNENIKLRSKGEGTAQT